MIIASYICTFLNYVLYCVSRFVKEKRTMLLLDLGAKILTIIALFLLGSMSGVYGFVIMMLAIVLSYIKEKKGYRWTVGYVLIELLYVLVLLFQFEGLSSILIFVSSSMTVFGIWFLRPQNMRKLGIVVSVIYLAYQLSIQNWAGLLEFFVLAANIISLIKYREKIEKE